MKKILYAVFALTIATSLMAAKRPQWNKTSANKTYQVYAGTIAIVASDGLDVSASSATFTPTIKLYGDTGEVEATSGDFATMNATTFNLIPPGIILPYISTSSIPSGYLYCNGQAVSTTTYSALYAAIGFKFGNPGGGNMNIPDMRGMFMRGVDDGRGLDHESTRVVGSTQTDTFQGHYHRIGYINSGGGQGGTNGIATALNTYQTHEPISDETNGTPRTSSETRPKNIAISYIIKY